jgi:hypothetical protein
MEAICSSETPVHGADASTDASSAERHVLPGWAWLPDGNSTDGQSGTRKLAMSLLFVAKCLDAGCLPWSALLPTEQTLPRSIIVVVYLYHYWATVLLLKNSMV